MKILIINNGSKHLRNLIKLLSPNKLDIYPFAGDYPPANSYDLIILSGGSKFSLPSHPSIFKKEVKLAQTAKVPIIGICQGCEIIARAYGAHLNFQFPKFKGVKQIKLTVKHFLGVPSEFKVFDAHFWAIKNLGNDLSGIATSERGFEIIKHNSKRIYGLMFHPEMFADKTLGDEVFRKILETIIKK